MYREVCHNFKIGYKNSQGLHNKNGCKLDDCSKEFTCDIEILSETWGCNCEKNTFENYDILAQVDPQKHKGTKKGRKSGGIRDLPQFIMHTGPEQKHTGHKVFLVLQSTGQKVFSASILRGTYFFYIPYYGAQTFFGCKYELGEN